MDPELLSTLLKESNLLGFAKDDALHMQIKSSSKLRNLVDYVSKRLNDGQLDQIFCWGLPGAVDKVVSFAENIKSLWFEKLVSQDCKPSLFQCTRFFSHAVQMRVEDYLVKANKPSLVVLLSREELVDSKSSEEKKPIKEIATAEQEIPATETPFPSRRRKSHQKKKRRRETDKQGGFRPPKSKKPKHELSQTKPSDTVSDPCHRLIPANNLAKKAVREIDKKFKS